MLVQGAFGKAADCRRRLCTVLLQAWSEPVRQVGHSVLSVLIAATSLPHLLSLASAVACLVVCMLELLQLLQLQHLMTTCSCA